jgi:hypothetical protein
MSLQVAITTEGAPFAAEVEGSAFPEERKTVVG